MNLTINRFADIFSNFVHFAEVQKMHNQSMPLDFRVCWLSFHHYQYYHSAAQHCGRQRRFLTSCIPTTKLTIIVIICQEKYYLRCDKTFLRILINFFPILDGKSIEKSYFTSHFSWIKSVPICTEYLILYFLYSWFSKMIYTLGIFRKKVHSKLYCYDIEKASLL